VDAETFLDGLDFELPFHNPEGLSEPPGELPLIEGPGNILERQFLGPYELISRIGHGGVAIVYRARHMHPSYAERPMAIKVLHQHLCDDVQVIELFRREARVLSLIKHPNVVETFEAGVEDGRMFLVMEYVDGRDLENLLWRARQLGLMVPEAVYLHIVAEVLRGLGFAHNLRDFDDTALGMVHRDVNPANVFIAFDGRVKLGDFGVTSVLTEPSKKHREVAGKVGYFAPEQLSGAAGGPSADLFAVGVMLFEILCGRRLFDADNSDAAMRLNAAAQVPDIRAIRPDISQGLIDVTLRALSRKPQERFQSAGDMLAALAPYLSERRAMTLALRSLMRTAFVLDHGRELQLRERLGAHNRRAAARATVDIVTGEPEAQQALAQLLERDHFIARAHSHAESLYKAQAQAPAQVILWGLSPENVPAGHSPAAALPNAHVIAMGRTLDTATIAWAVNLGAKDLLFRPLPPERVLFAVRAGALSTPPSHGVEGAAVPRKLRMLLVTADKALLEQWRREFLPQGYQVAHASSLEEAHGGAMKRSFELCVIDLNVAPGGYTAFIEAYRAAPGMGLVPMLLLAHQTAQFGLEAWPERAQVAFAEGPFGDAVDKILRGTPGGNTRTYDRYDTNMPLQVRFGGRVFPAEAINVSRGGLLLHTAHLPSINTELGLVMDLGNGQRAEAQGTALRVLLGRQRNQSTEGASIGIALRKFFGDGEARYIERIAELAQSQAPQPQPGFSARARGWLHGLQRL